MDYIFIIEPSAVGKTTLAKELYDVPMPLEPGYERSSYPQQSREARVFPTQITG